MEKKDIASYSFEELQEEMLAIGEKGFRSRQIYSWIHEKLVDDFEEMTNLPKLTPETGSSIRNTKSRNGKKTDFKD